MPTPIWVPEPPIEEHEPDRLPDEMPRPNPDENPACMPPGNLIRSCIDEITDEIPARLRQKV